MTPQPPTPESPDPLTQDSFSASTLKLTTNFIVEAVSGGGVVLVHGCDGFDQSAAVAAAALMRSYTATLEVGLVWWCGEVV